MEWLSRWWKELLRDVVLTAAGLTLIGYEAIAARTPSIYLIGAGLSLTFPSTFAKIREVAASAGTAGGQQPPLPPHGPEPSPLPSGHTDE